MRRITRSGSLSIIPTPFNFFANFSEKVERKRKLGKTVNNLPPVIDSIESDSEDGVTKPRDQIPSRFPKRIKLIPKEEPQEISLLEDKTDEKESMIDLKRKSENQLNPFKPPKQRKIFHEPMRY